MSEKHKMSRKRPISGVDECNNNDTETQMEKRRRTTEERLRAQLQSDFTEKMIVPITPDGPHSRFGRKIKSISPSHQKNNQVTAEQSPSLSKRKKQPTDNSTNSESPIIDLCYELSASEPIFFVETDEKTDVNDSAPSELVDIEDYLKVSHLLVEDYLKKRNRRTESHDIIDEIDLTSSTEGSEVGDNADTKSNDIETSCSLELKNSLTSETASSPVSNASQDKTESPSPKKITTQTPMAEVSITLTDCVRSTSINSDAISDKPFSEGTSDDCVIADADDDQSDFDSTDNWYAGKIVWASLAGFSFWPAVVFNSEDDNTFHRDNHINVKFLYDNGRHNWVNEKSAILPFRGRDEFVERSKLPINKRNKAYRINSSKKWELAICEANALLCIKREMRVDFYDTILLNAVHEMDRILRSDRRKTGDRSDTPQTIETGYSSLKQYPSPASLSPNLNEIDRNYDVVNNYFKSVELSHPEVLHEEDLQMDDPQIMVSSITESPPATDKIYCRLTKLVFDNLRDDEISVTQNAIANDNKFMKNLNELSSRMSDVKSNITMNTSSSTTRTSRRPSIDSLVSGSSSSIQQKTARQKTLAKNKARLEADKQKTMAVEKPPTKIKPTKEEKEKKKLQMAEELIRDCHMKNHSANFLLKGLSKDPMCHCCLESGAVMKCAGQCSAYFHKTCLDKELNVTEYNAILKRKMRRAEESSPPVSTIEENTEKQKCVSCTATQANQCFVCSKSDDNCIQCDKNCGKAYHVECLKYWPQRKLTYAGNKIKSLQCPRHICHTCVSDNIQNMIHNTEPDKKLIKCLLCPGTYHRSSECIPAGSELLSESQLICARHQTNKPSKHIDFCLFCSNGGELICCDMCVNAIHAACINVPVGDHFICEECESGRRPLNGNIVWCRYSNSPWWPAIIVPPPCIPDNVLSNKKEPNQMCVFFFGTHNYGWVSQAQIYLYITGDGDCQVKNATEGLRNAIAEAEQWMKCFEEIDEKSTKPRNQKPPPYKKLRTGNKLMAKFNPGEYNECKCRPDDPAPCSRTESNCENAILNTECEPTLCPAKDKCQNQNLIRGGQFSFQVKMTKGKGWGLFALEEIPVDRFLIEYMGEVIDNVEFDQRFSRALAQKDDNYYFLFLSNNRYIDAKEYGNEARFINHSCDPNAETQKWTVYSNGQEHIRIGFFTKRKILPGEEITFDYNWGTENMKTKCQCGAKTCRGHINK